jgi:hypothetical protein
MSPNYFSPFTCGRLVKTFSMTLTQPEFNSGSLAINVGLARRLKVNLAGGQSCFRMDGFDGGMLDALSQLQELSAGDPVPVMKAKESPLIGSDGGR